VQAVRTQLPSETLGAFPERLQTAWGSFFKALALKKDEDLLIRGGTTPVGLAAAAIAKKFGVRVISATRNPERENLLRLSSADQVIVDSGTTRQRFAKRFRAACTRCRSS